MPRSRLSLMGLALLACSTPDAEPRPVASAARPVEPAPVASAGPGGTSASSAPAHAVAPERWTDESMVAELKARFDAQRGDFVLAVSLDSELGDEGELYLERRGDRLSGRWDSTLVSATLGPSGALTVRDEASNTLIFEGTGAPGQLTGTLYGEMEQRAVKAARPRDLARLHGKLDVNEWARPLTFTFDHGKAKSTTITLAKKRRQVVTARVVDGTLELTDERGTWTLHPTARALVGRSPTGVFTMARLASPETEVRLPWKDDRVDLTTTTLGRGKYPKDKCEISVSQPSVKGTPHDAEIGARLRQLALDASSSPGRSLDTPARPSDFVCQLSADTPIQIQSAWYTAWPLRGGFVGLQLTSYTRFSEGPGVMTSAQCLLLDSQGGRLIEDIGKEMPEALQKSVIKQANRVMRRRVRSANVTEPNKSDYLEELTSLGQVTTCLTADGIELRIPSGSIVRSPAGIAVAETITVPTALVARDVPAGHPLARLLTP